MRALRFSSLLIVLVLASSSAVEAQNFNVTRLTHMNDHDRYSDIWGYTAPDGREYALVGEKAGTIVIDVTDPLNTVEVGYIPGTSCTWRDMKTYGTHAYIVNDCLGGVQVVDLGNPSNPVVVNEFGFSFLGHAHNVQIDTDTGMLYAVGTDQGMGIYNLAADPVNPPLVTTWNGQGVPGGSYVHDLFVKDGMAHVAMIYAGEAAILDVSNLPSISVLSHTKSGEEFTHSTWTNEDNTLLVTADERTGVRNIQLWDISNPGSPVLMDAMAQGPSTIPHNPFIKDDVCHVAFYEEGYIAFDISNPANVKKAGEFDTTPGSGSPGLFAGAWGCYPFADSGFVYISDITNGFHLMKLNPDCEDDPSGRPMVCDVWPDDFDLDAPLHTSVLVSGSNMSGATSVDVGGVLLGPGQFDVLDSQTVAFDMPALPDVGLVAVSVGNASGMSDPSYVSVLRAGAPSLEATPTPVEVGETIGLTLLSEPGDLQYLGFSLFPSPSIVPNTVAFDIGSAFSSLFLFAPFNAGPTGQTVIPPLAVPAAGAGLTVFWQFAAAGGQVGAELPTSNVRIHSILP